MWRFALWVVIVALLVGAGTLPDGEWLSAALLGFAAALVNSYRDLVIEREAARKTR